jgi:hypothetical protein
MGLTIPRNKINLLMIGLLNGFASAFADTIADSREAGFVMGNKPLWFHCFVRCQIVRPTESNRLIPKLSHYVGLEISL